MKTHVVNNGQVTGVFTGDEYFAGKNPSQGTVLRVVVEYMYSLEELISIFGDSSFADRLVNMTSRLISLYAI